jgi:uncharacterized protein YecE (DUF72 family)
MIRTGIGGWVYPEWRKGVFYPEGLAQKRELEWASRQLGAIEINGTYHSLQKPESFRRWREETPEGFVFAVKGSSYITNRKVLAAAGEALPRFFGQGLEELGDRLGPIVWQLMGTKKFEPGHRRVLRAAAARASRACRCATRSRSGTRASPVRNLSTCARKAGGDRLVRAGEPRRSRPTADFAYLRCKNAQEPRAAGLSGAKDRIAACAARGTGEAPAGLPYAGDPQPKARQGECSAS